MNAQQRLLAGGCALAIALLLPNSAQAQVTVGSQVRVDTGRGTGACNETTISASKANPLEIVAGWNDYREGLPRTGIGLSLDGGLSWTDFLLRPAPQFQSVAEGDPMTCADDRTGTIWAGGISFAPNGGVFVARKDPGAAGFGNVVMSAIGGGWDKGWMAAGPDPNAPASQTLVYIALNLGLLVSADMGDTWSPPNPLGVGLGFLPKTGPNGELYVAYWDWNDRVELIRSLDGGASLSSPILIAQRMDVWGIDGSRFPGNYRVASFQGLAVDPNDGTLYCVYPDTTAFVANGANVDIYFTKSVDQGSTWSPPVVVNDDAATPGDQFFPWIEVDANGRLHMTFYDTRNIVQNDSDSHGLIDAYYSYSDDGGTTWTEIRLTASAFTSATDGFGGIFIGDYLGLSTAGNRTLPFYMTTQNGDADVFTHVIQDGPGTEYCFGIGCPCGNDDPDAGCGNLGVDCNPATGARLTASGSAVLAADDLVLTVAGMPSTQFGIVYTGAGIANVPFGDGRQCIEAPFFRYFQDMSDASGSMSLGPGQVVSYANANFGMAGMVVVGSTWHYQCWFRDPGGPCGSNFNLSNAVSVTWE